jgi:hypothetical protein
MIRLSVAVLVLVAFTACATEDPSEFARPGPYLGLAVVGAGSNFKKMADEDLDDGVGTAGVQALFGYKMWDRAAVEIAYEGGMTFKGKDADVDLWNVMLQAKILMGGERWQPYLLVGAGWGEAKLSDPRLTEDGFVGRIGLGLQYYISPSWPLFLEFDYNAGAGDLGDYNYYSGKFGVLFRF